MNNEEVEKYANRLLPRLRCSVRPHDVSPSYSVIEARMVCPLPMDRTEQDVRTALLDMAQESWQIYRPLGWKPPKEVE